MNARQRLHARGASRFAPVLLLVCLAALLFFLKRLLPKVSAS